MEDDQPQTGWRASPELWLDAAYTALLQGGVEAVRIVPLAKSLKISRTSFYWFFKDRDDLLEHLIARWRAKNTASLVKQTEAYAETIVEAMLNVFDCWHDQALFDSQFEFGVRTWAFQSLPVLREVAQADRLRLEALVRMYRRFGFETVEAEVRARTAYLVQIGYISMQTVETVDVRMGRVPKYIEIFTGIAPREGDLRRFYARIGFDQGVTLHAEAR